MHIPWQGKTVFGHLRNYLNALRPSPAATQVSAEEKVDTTASRPLITPAALTQELRKQLANSPPLAKTTPSPTPTLSQRSPTPSPQMTSRTKSKEFVSGKDQKALEHFLDANR